MPNVHAPIKGIPATAQVDIVLRYPLQQIGTQGLPAAEYRLRSMDGGATYLDRATNATPDVPASGESDPYPTDPIEAEITVTASGTTRTSTMYLLPVQIGGVLDLTQPLTPVGWIAPVTLTNLITDVTAAGEAAQVAADAVTAATLDLSAERTALAGQLLENAVYASDTADDPPLPSPYRAGVRGRKLTSSGNVLYLVTAPVETPGWLPTQELLSGDAVAAVEAAAADARQAAGEATAAIGGISGLRLIEAAEGLTAPDGTPLVLAAVDDNGATPFYVDVRARAWFLEVQAGGMLIRTEADTGLPWALTDSAERMAAWVTSLGEFDVARPGPNLRAALAAYTALVCEGDSMTFGVGASNAFRDPDDGTAGGGYPRVLHNLLGAGVQVINRGVPSATANDIAARMVGGGGVAALYSAGPISGGVYPLWGRAEPSPCLTPGRTFTQRGRLGPARGTLSRDNSPADWQGNRAAYYTFTPDPGQSALETSADPTTGRRAYPWQPDLVLPEQPRILWYGRNNGTDAAHTVSALRARLSRMRPDTPRLVIGVLPRQSETWANGGRQIIEDGNRLVAALAGGAFFDPCEVLCRNPDGSYTANGAPYPGYMADDFHCNDAGYAALAPALYARIHSERWFL